ncbi:MAG: 16S rRNA (guanine(527)-N(7))-methyltransferase RsmG [Bacteroides sp.]|nr:16S rRNA (guanine(527)-N(7))-methyltransferase RsmG [Bacteroides sp.]
MYEDICEKCKEAGFFLDEARAEKLSDMTVFLQDYCSKVNLTAIRDREGIIEKHIVDSILPLELFKVKKKARCLDIGTGAGFPAVPMMIYRDDLCFTLLDAQRKRTDYLKLLTEKLGLTAEIIHGRAEELCRQTSYKNGYDMVTARAVSDLPTLFKYAVPFLKSGGIFMALRGAKRELNDDMLALAKAMKLRFREESDYLLPNGDGRRLIVFEKI